MNTSFPYLQLAKQYQMPYWQVLCYADYLEKTANADALRPTPFEIQASACLTTTRRIAVEVTWMAERKRREEQGRDREAAH